MWKAGLRLVFIAGLLFCLFQVTFGSVYAKKWFQPNRRYGAVERVCRNGAVVSGVSDFALKRPTAEQIGTHTVSATIQMAVYTYTRPISNVLPTELGVEGQFPTTTVTAYGSLLAEDVLRLTYGAIPVTLTENSGASVIGTFYDYTSLTLRWSQVLDPQNDFVVIGGVTDGLFYAAVEDCYLDTIGYQGTLADAGSSANGIYDFQFGIYDASTAGNLMGDVVDKPGVTVTNGAVNVELPVAMPSLTGAPRWLEVRVKALGAPDYTILSPRQPILATPYALDAQNAHYANTSGYSLATRGIFVGPGNTVTLTNTLYIDLANPGGAPATDQWALYTPGKILAGAGYLQQLTLIAQVAAGEPLAAGDLAAVIGVGAPLPGTSAPVPLVSRAVDPGLAGVIGVVAGPMTVQAEATQAGLHLFQTVDGLAQAGSYVAITTYGAAQVKAQAITDVIAPGQRLTAGQLPGTVRTLRTETLNGMVVSEGAPVIGVALAPVDPVTGLLPVLVTLR